MRIYEFDVFTIMECDTNSIADVIGAPTQCNPCSSTIINCMNCASPVNCVLCIGGWGTHGTQCIPCSSAIANCVNWTNTTKCVSSVIGWILDGSQCSFCSDVIFHCLICVNGTKCIDCMVGWPVAGGCTNVTQCVSVVQNYLTRSSPCTTCRPGFTLNNSLCSCPNGYWVIVSYCINIVGCVATRLIGSQAICSACDPSKRL